MSKHDTNTKTDLDLVIDLWNEVLRKDYKQNHKLFISDTFEIKIGDGTKEGYDIAGMSDGEKDILYIITKTIYGVKTQQKKCVIVDEPEIHMHKSVLPTLWTKLEKECDCPFIYFTHDIDFAETRKYNKFWLKEFNYNTNIMKLDKLDGSIPPELYKLLGVTKNILFCEGKIDGQLYSLLFPDRLVIKAGNCDKVIQYTKTYNEKHLGKAIGIIDRDYHTDEYADKLHEKEEPTIFVLNVAEVENIFLQEDVLQEYINDSNKVKQIKIDIANQMLKDLPTISIKAVEFHIAKELRLQTTIDRQKNEISNLNIDGMIQAKSSFFQELANQVKNNPDHNSSSYIKLIKYYNKKGLREIVENKIESNDFKEDIMNKLTNNNQLKIFLTHAFPPELRKFLPEDLQQSTDDSSLTLTSEHIYATETIDSLPIQTSSIDETQQSVDHSTEDVQNIIIDEPITQKIMAQNDNKILVSFIGNSLYEDATYTSTMFDGNSKSKYVQSVIVDKILSLEENDKVVIFRTNNSQVENYYNNLKEQLVQKNIVITDVIIEEGDDEEEVWNIFDKIYKEVIKFGNVYFDITYSFRSIPLLVSEILNFASTMHDSKVKAIYYAKVSGRHKYNIINLLPVVDMQEYTRLASDFKKYGRVKGLGEQYDDTNAIRNALIDFDNYIQFNNLAKIKEGEYLRDIFADIESDTEIPLSFIKNELRETLRSYGFSCGSSDSYDSWDNIKAAILWCQEHDMFIQAFSLAREYVNLYLAQYFGVNNYMPSDQDDVNKLNDFCFDKFKAAGFVEAISLILEQTGYSHQTELMNTINDIRSQVNSIDNSFDEKTALILSNADVLSISYKTCNDKLINTSEKYEIEDFLKKCKNIKNKMGHTDITNDVTDMIGYANQLLATMNNVIDRIVFAKKNAIQPIITEYKTTLKELRNNLDHCKSDFSEDDYIAYKNYNFTALFNLLHQCS